jgi:hypothetical protein
MKQLITIGSWGLLLLALGGLYMQHRRVAQLEAKLASVAEKRSISGEIADEVAGLAARVGRLERIVSFRPPTPASPSAAAPTAATSPPVAAPTAAAGEVHQLREDVDALLTGEATSTEQGKARLRELIAETQQQQMIERMTRRDERLLQRLTENARLNSRQRDDLNKALEEERTQRRELLAKARAGSGNFEEMRPALQALRAQTDQKAKAILDAEQYNQYTSSRQNRGPRERGGANPAGTTNP